LKLLHLAQLGHFCVASECCNCLPHLGKCASSVRVATLVTLGISWASCFASLYSRNEIARFTIKDSGFIDSARFGSYTGDKAPTLLERTEEVYNVLTLKYFTMNCKAGDVLQLRGKSCW